MSSEEIRKKFRDFFEKKHDHKWVNSSSLIPDDPSVLLTTAGMQQFKRYYTGELDAMKDFGSKNTVSIQKSFRTSDIDEVGDETHNTFFEMLGHFSFGDYFKKETIEWEYEFLTNVLNISPDRISATVFAGDEGIPFDKESYDIWSRLLPADRIRRGSREDNVWGPAGSEGPCGAANEVYVDNVEIGTLVFMEYYSAQDKSLTPLLKKGVDVGLGLERLAMKVQNVPTIFETDLFQKPFGFRLIAIGGVDIRYNRIFADHLRASIFLIADGVKPLNKDAGYILRRLIRRTVVSLHKMGLSGSGSESTLATSLDKVIDYYGSFYNELLTSRELTKQTWLDEKIKFEKTLEMGLKEFEARYPALRAQTLKPGESYRIQVPQNISGKDAFDLHQSYGFTIDVLRDLAREGIHKIDERGFEEEFRKHKEISRAGSEKKFGGHGLILDTGELKAGSEEELKKVLRLHTATHLLQQALREVLGKEVQQRGSDITAERTRFDFSFPRKLTSEEIKKVEDLVNQKVKENLPVSFVELPKAEAEKVGALHFFSAKGGSASGGKEKYPDKVKVYFVGKSLDTAWSKEFCGGPHVKRTGEIGKFKIIKEEAVGSGTRRIRGMVE